MREAASRVFMEALWQAGAKVQPMTPKRWKRLSASTARDNLAQQGTKKSTLKGADALVIVTEWQSFRAPDFDSIK